MLSADFFTQIDLFHYLILSAVLFVLGIIGVLLRKNIVTILMSIELMLNAVNLSFVSYSKFLNLPEGQVIVFFVMCIAAAEAAVGLAILVSIFKRFKEIHLSLFEHMKG